MNDHMADCDKSVAHSFGANAHVGAVSILAQVEPGGSILALCQNHFGSSAAYLATQLYGDPWQAPRVSDARVRVSVAMLATSGWFR